MGLREAAERLGVHYMTAYRHVRTGRLAAVREGGRWLVEADDLQRKLAPPPAEARWSPPGALADRMVAGDEAGSWMLVESALASGADPPRVVLDLLAPALAHIGGEWAAGRWSVADEHRATAVALRVVGRLGPRFVRPGRSRGTVVVGAAPGDSHGLPSALVADLLRGEGFSVLDLGANPLPTSFASTAAGAERLVAVLVGATTGPRDAAIRTAVRAARPVGAPVLVGGAAVADEAHAHRLGADGWSGPTGADVVAAVRALRGE